MTHLTTSITTSPISPAKHYPNPHPALSVPSSDITSSVRKIENSSLSGGRMFSPSAVNRFGYTPTTGTRDEENTPVVVRIGEDNTLPFQDPAVFTNVNDCADELRITELGVPVFKLDTGFRTIQDWMVYVFHQNTMGSGTVMQMVNVIDGASTPLQDISDIYCNMINKPVVEMGALLKLLAGMGFVRMNVIANHLKYTKFNHLNLVCEEVSISLRGSRRSALIDGHVKPQTYELIKEAFIGNLVPVKEKIELRQLDDFRKDQDGSTEPDFSTHELTDDMDYALPEFYPWIKMDLEEYFRQFLESRDNVLVLIGPPGTGKSTLIRTIIRNLKVRAMLAYKPDVVMSPQFIKTCQNFLEADHSYRDYSNAAFSDGPVTTHRPHKAIIVEDADLIMAKRSDGNHRMSEILNATSGIATDSHSKFILSTNLKDIDDIDPALLRPGRCFDILGFRELSAAEATAVRAARGLEPREFASNRRYKLAEVLTNSVTQHQVQPIVKPRFGFGN